MQCAVSFCMKTKLFSRAVAAVAIIVSIMCGPLLRANETDNRIESAAKNSYVFKTYLRDDSIRARSKDGVVTLTGVVSQESHKTLAQDTVASLPAVKRVENLLEVKGERSAGERPDAWLAAKVRSALIFHRNVSATKTDVDVKDGIVILHGEAVNEAQKELTTEYARDVEGVRDVRNEMTIVPDPPGAGDRSIGEVIDDASITAQVKMSLATHRSTSALKTKVLTRDGAVTVTGVARSEAEKALVTKLVSDIRGVKIVVNNMIVSTSVTQN
jgi:hyperosmotically inducible protein